MSTAKQEQRRSSSCSTQAPDESEHAAAERENLEGWVAGSGQRGEIREALEKAFDYRGDMTIARKDGSTVERISV